MPITPEALSAIIADHCEKEPQWISKLQNDPRVALEEMTGHRLPAELNIHVHQNDADSWHIPLPNNADGIRVLDDNITESIVGGEVWITAIGLSLGFLAITAIAIGINLAPKKDRDRRSKYRR